VQKTQRIKIGPAVTNPIQRHPVVTAAAAASLDEISGGRAFIGLGGGDSALYNIGLKGASVAQIEDYARTINALYRDGESRYRDTVVRLAWARKPVPIYMAGRIAEGVIVGTGVLPEVVADSLGHIEAGAHEAGRTLEDIDIWWLLMGSLDESPARALDDIKHSLTTYANLAFRFTPEGKHLPPEYLDAVKRIHAEYRPKDHVTGGADRKHQQLADETGFTRYLASRFSVAGTPEQVLERISEAHAMGAKQLWITLRFPGKERFFRLWERRVLPALK
jgi:5,10-methylenetetrahydromethanopterin reductase